MSAQPKPYLTPEQYLEIERKAEFRSEYYQGEMFAMAGAKLAHLLIVGNIAGEIRTQFRRKSCQVYTNDMRVRVKATSYTYPDVVAVCGEPQVLDGHLDTLLNPALLVEVLSRTTEAYDRGLKFELYKAIASLREYMLVTSDRLHVDLYTRQPDGRWLLTSADAPEDTLTLESIGVELKLADLYEKVEFASDTQSSTDAPAAAL